MLTAIQNAARVEPASYPQWIAKVVLDMLSAAQEAETHGDLFRMLASDACCVVYRIVTLIEQTQEKDINPPLDFEKSVKDLFEMLKEIEMFFNKLQTRSFFMRFRVIIMSRSDANRILEYRQTLDHFSARLALQLNIIIRIALAQFSQRQDAILDALRQESEDHLFQQHILTGSISAPNSTFLAIN